MADRAQANPPPRTPGGEPDLQRRPRRPPRHLGAQCMRLPPTVTGILNGAFLLTLPRGALAAEEVAHDAHPTPATEAAAILFDNLGSHHHAITTKSPQAQAFFDQGLR